MRGAFSNGDINKSMRASLYSLIFFQVIVFSQITYPADTLLMDPGISIFKKIAISPISGWQRISYNTNIFNCQYYPSCSNYGASAIKKFGWAKGAMMASDRITRCNPAAHQYHLEAGGLINSEGYLYDPTIPEKLTGYQRTKSPFYAGGLSAVLPGLGRAYAGRPYEGFLSGLMILFMGQLTLNSYNNNGNLSPVFTAFFLTMYGGEIYGSYRLTKYHH